jgi:hypothetical protein
MNKTQENQKQETIEEAAKNYVKTIFDNGIPLAMQNVFKEGAKWQAERMYSEEEVHKIIENYQDNMENNPGVILYDKWFEQFKKKQL